MLKRLALIVTIISFVGFNASAEDIGITKEETVCPSFYEELDETGKIRITKEETVYEGLDGDVFYINKLKIELSEFNSDFNNLIVDVIKNLVKEIEPEKAANMYLMSIRKNIDILRESNFEKIAECKTNEEAKEVLNDFIQNLINKLSSQEVVLESAIYFAALPEDVVKNVNNSLVLYLQKFLIQFSEQSLNLVSTEPGKVLRNVFENSLSTLLNNLAESFEEYYYIDRQVLGLQ